jgi:hypothetical protein
MFVVSGDFSFASCGNPIDEKARQEHLGALGTSMMDTEPKESEAGKNAENLLRRSALYKEFIAEREEILKHKWIESEKAGYDIGFERALLDWIVKYRSGWRKGRKHTTSPDS